jgi:hypothetical protein
MFMFLHTKFHMLWPSSTFVADSLLQESAAVTKVAACVCVCVCDSTYGEKQ